MAPSATRFVAASSSPSSMDSYIESELCTRVLELTYSKIQNRPRKSNLRRSLMIYNVMIKAKKAQLEHAKAPRASVSLSVSAAAVPKVAVPVAKPVGKSNKNVSEKSKADGPLEYRVKDVEETSKPPRWYHRLLQLPFATDAMVAEEALAADDICVVPELSEQLFNHPQDNEDVEEEEFDAPPTIFQSDSSSSDEEELDEDEDSGLGHPGRKRKTSTPRLSATAEKRYCSFENITELDDEEEDNEADEELGCDGFFRGRSQSAPIYGSSKTNSLLFPGYGRVTDQLVPGANLQIASCN
ncbi:hypothetical protein L596_029812 [Steinernema carpocapsae]|uniref:Uncharacterized protein n=1 Tax=Steinernema carpocapsae TaxID=34508 RepID=A0A4U5LQW2_STECR|nr:hypothetical protein L596_029812 [Steinernema carpocapsae]